MNIGMGKKQQAKNIFLNIAAFGVQFFISFYISPIVVANAGKEAYGFLSLAYDMTSYATILSSVINAAASRFIADAFYKNDLERARGYFNSLIAANAVLTVFFSIVGAVVVPNLDKLLSIPPELIFDVKITFALVFVAYLINLMTMVFTTSTFVVNRTDIQGTRNIIQYVVRFAMIMVFFSMMPVHIYWVALATLIATCAVAVLNVRLTKVLTPEIIFGRRFLRSEYIVTVIKAGVWVSLTNLSTTLLRGLDLTVANVFLGSYEMGILSIARTLPNYLTSIILTIVVLFTPEFISHYAKGETKALTDAVNRTEKTMAALLFVPVSGFIVFSYDFYKLWQDSLVHEELVMVAVLSALTGIQAYFDAVTSPMTQLNVVVNKLKIPALVSLACGVVSVALELILIQFTDLGVYSIVLSTTVVLTIRYLIFNPLYAAWCTGCSVWCFLPNILKSCGTVPVLLLMMVFVRGLLPIHSWTGFFITIAICGVLGYALVIVLLARKDCKLILQTIRQKYIAWRKR